MQPFRGPPPPRGFPGAIPPPIAGMGGHPHPLMHPPSIVGGGVMPPPRGAIMQPPPRGGPMIFAPHGMAPRFPGVVPFGAHGMNAGPPGVTKSAPPPPGTVDIPVPVVELPDTGQMNVFVGKLPPDLHDSYIRQLLEKCGTVVTWKRTADPVTGKPKGFGYCTFSTANDVLRALRLLNGFFVDSREILVKVDSKTQAKLDVVTKAMTEKMKLEEHERDDEIKRELRNLVEVRSGLMGGQQNDVATWGELLEKKTTAAVDLNDNSSREQQDQKPYGTHGGSGDEKPEGQGAGDSQSGDTSLSSDAAPVHGERIRGKMIMSEIEKFRLAQEQREQEQEQKRREAVLERLRREKEDDERRKAADERRREADERRRAAEEKRKAVEEEAEKARKDAAATRGKRREENDGDESSTETDEENEDDVRSRKSSRSRRREKERDHDLKKRSTRERERDHNRNRGRDHRSRSRSRSRERSRRHRSSRKKSRSRSRTRSRSRSRHYDRGHDRECRKRRHRRDSSDADDRSDHDNDERKRSSKRRRDDSTRDRRTRAEREREEDVTVKDKGRSPGDKAKSSSPQPRSPAEISIVEAPKAVAMPKVVLGLKMASVTVKKEKPVTIPAVSAFALEEEVVAKPLRELVPIDYTEEEKLAGASVQQRVAATVARINSRSEDVKSLIDQIPTATAELFAFSIDWQAVDQYKIVKDKMEPWVTKKIVEYLGEDEPTLLEFLLKKLQQHARAVEILEELQLVLDDDAEVFVKLLWRKLAFEAVRARISNSQA